ncbi:MAG: hypothetical protein EBU31_12925 [Proteobacteria bacterium]|nr:hypothetical protein [Pseudomonadota bacterium]
MIALLRAMLRAFASDRGALLLAFLAPVAFFTMFALFFRHLDSPSGVSFDVVVTAPAGNADAERFVRTIVAAPHGRIHAWSSIADVPDGRADAFIDLDSAFTGARPRVAIRSESALPGVGDAVREVVRATVADAFHDGAASVEVDDRSVGGTLLGASAAGIAVMFALFSCSSLALRGLADEGAGFGDRLRSLRIGRLRRVGARMLALAIIAGVQLAWTFLFAAVAFGVVPASPAALVAAVIASAAAIAGTVVALAAMCRTRARFAAISPVVTLVLSGLGGSMVPLVLMPPLLAWPSRALFSAWAIDACSAGLRADPSMPALALLAAWTASMVFVASAAEPEYQP